MSPAPWSVALATDAVYAPHAAVAIHSLLARHPGQPIELWLLVEREEGPMSNALARLQQLVGAGPARLQVLPIPPLWRRRLRAHPQFGLHAWLRLLLPVLLPDRDRVLYLDSDLVVSDRLEALWSVDLQGQLLAAVHNPLYPHQSAAWQQALGIPDPARYFNSGVLLLDLAALRAGDWTERLLHQAAASGEALRFPDQDVLNQAFWSRWQPLPPRFNAQAIHFDLPPRQLSGSAEALRAARHRPAIVHYTGQHKPWLHACRHPRRALYWQHRRQTPWADGQPLHPRLRNWLLRELPYPLHRWLLQRWPQPELARAAPQDGVAGPGA